MTKKQMQDEVYEGLEDLEERWTYGESPEGLFVALRPLIADAADDPEQFKADMREAFETEDRMVFEALDQLLTDQLLNANAQQVRRYWDHYMGLSED